MLLGTIQLNKSNSKVASSKSLTTVKYNNHDSLGFIIEISPIRNYTVSWHMVQNTVERCDNTQNTSSKREGIRGGTLILIKIIVEFFKLYKSLCTFSERTPVSRFYTNSIRLSTCCQPMSNSVNSPVIVKIIRSQIFVTRSAARSKLWAAHSR